MMIDRANGVLHRHLSGMWGRASTAAVIAATSGVLALGAAAPGHAATSADDYISSAIEYRGEGRPRASVIELKNAIKEDPNNATARLLLGEIYIELGDVLRAEKEIQRARSLEARYDRWAPALGYAWLQMGRFEAILEDLDPARAKKAETAALLLTVKANALRGLGRPEEAMASFQAAIERDPSGFGPYVGLSRLAMASGDRAAAETWHDRAVAASPDAFDVMALTGDLHFSAGRYAEAEEAYRKITELRPHNIIVRVPLAHTMLINKKIEGAVEILDQVILAAPNHLRAVYLRASAAYALLDYETALTHAETVLRFNDADASAQLLAGAASYALGINEQAHDYLRSFLGKQPNHEMGLRLYAATKLRLGQTEEAMAILEPLAETDDENILVMIGAAAINNRDLVTGRTYIERYAELNPDNAAARAQLGVIKLGLGEHDEGIQDLQHALELDPEFDRAILALFAAHIRDGRQSEALALTERIVTERPDSALGHMMAGIAYFSAGDHATANAAFERALEIDPGSLGAKTNLARIRVAENDADGARDHLLSILEDHPSHMITLINLARLEALFGFEKAALRWLERAKKAHPDAVQPRYVEARLHMQQDHPHRAVGIAQELVNAHPKNPTLLQLLGEAQIAANQSVIAVTTFRALVQLVPQNADAWYLLAKALDATGDRDGYEQGLQDALARDPGHTRATVEFARLKLVAGDARSAVDFAEAVLRGRPNDGALLEVSGKAYQALGDQHSAVRMYRQLTEQMPDNAEAYFLLGRALGMSGAGTEGLQAIERSLELNEAHHGARLIRARARLARRDMQSARADLAVLKAALPQSPEVLELEGAVMLSEGKYAEASRINEQAYVAEPTASRAIQLARAQWLSDQQRLAIATLRSWLEAHPDDALPRQSLADFFLASEDFESARREYDTLVVALPDDAALRNNFAWALWKTGRVNDGLSQARIANDLRPGDPRIQDTLGTILLDAGETERALQVLRDAAEGAPRHATIQFNLARALARVGSYDEARDVLKSILAQHASFAERAAAEHLLEDIGP